MKKLFGFTAAALIMLSGCGGGSYNNGELTGVSGRKKYYEPEPFGMVFIPQGSFNTGPSDQDVAWAQNSFSKTVTVDAFWMDETEITNNEYRQFVFYVRDSIMRRMLENKLRTSSFLKTNWEMPSIPHLLIGKQKSTPKMKPRTRH
jgi:formylglycine-generating enzyme